MKARKYICPVCKQKTGVDILYGYPMYEAFEMAQRKEIVLGGCCIEINEDGSQASPERACTSCEHQWQIKRRKFADDFDMVLPALEEKKS